MAHDEVLMGRVAQRKGLRYLALLTWTRGLLRTFLLLLPSLGWLMLFLIIPMVLVFIYGFASVTPTFKITFDPLTLVHYQRALNFQGAAVQLTLRTLAVGVLTTSISLLLGYPIAYFLARMTSERWRGPMVALLVIPFWVSFVVRLNGIIPFLRSGGFLDGGLKAMGMASLASFFLDNFGFGTAGAVPLVLIYLWVPYMILPLFTILLKIEPEWLEAAYNLGATRLRAFWHVTLPISLPGVITGSILVFITAVGSYVEPDLIAGSAFPLVGNLVWLDYNTPGGIPEGSATAVFIMATTLLLIFFYTRYAEATRGGVLVESRLNAWLRSLFRSFAARTKASLQLSPKKASPVGNGDSVMTGTPHQDGGKRTRRIFNPFSRVAKAMDVLAERSGHWILGGVTVALLLSFFVPLFQIVLFSFNARPDAIQWGGFSLRWYIPGLVPSHEDRAIFGNAQALNVLKNSVIVALTSTGIALILGTMAAIALSRHVFHGRQILKSVMYLGLVIPSIVMGISIAILMVFLSDFFLGPLLGIRWMPSLEAIIVGHATFNIPVVTIVMLISFSELDRTLEEAAMNLGADQIQTFFRVTLPLIKPGLVSATLLAFTFSFDELPVTLFLMGPGSETLPVHIWGLLAKKTLSPEIDAVSAIILTFAILFVLLANRVQKGGAIFRL